MDDRELDKQGIVDELRRRKVLRSTTIYAVSGWSLLQWSDSLFEQLGWPGWSVTLVLTVIVLGFPVIVALSWVFEVTPSGVRRTDPQRLSEGVRTPVSWAVDVVVLLFFGATVAMLLRGGVGV